MQGWESWDTAADGFGQTGTKSKTSELLSRTFPMGMEAILQGIVVCADGDSWNLGAKFLVRINGTTVWQVTGYQISRDENDPVKVLKNIPPGATVDVVCINPNASNDVVANVRLIGIQRAVRVAPEVTQPMPLATGEEEMFGLEVV